MPRRSAAQLAHAAILLGTMAALSPPISAGAGAGADELAACAAIAASDSRLACYDALAARTASHSPAAGSQPSNAAAAPPATANPATAATGAAPASATAIPARPAAQSSPDNFAENDPKNFGLSRAQLHEVAPGPSEIQGRIVKAYQNVPGRIVVVLDLGQTWTCSEDDGRLGVGEQVTIKRGALGSYSLVTSAHRVYKVQRMQ
jgi:hypothetical protein